MDIDLREDAELPVAAMEFECSCSVEAIDAEKAAQYFATLPLQSCDAPA